MKVNQPIKMLGESGFLHEIHNHRAYWEAQEARQKAFWLAIGILWLVALSVLLWSRW
jgi:hypothetical protein